MPTPPIESFEVEQQSAQELLMIKIERQKLQFAIDQMKLCWNMQDVANKIKELEKQLKQL